MSCPFSERFLQILWNERHLLPDLRLADGRSLRILSPGTWNNSGGPDFSHASILIDGQLHQGPVELHQQASDWFQHGHQQDPEYDNVILHVVWENDRAPIRDCLPTLELQNALLPEWERLLWMMEDACYSRARQISPGDCALRWALTEDDGVRDILQQAGQARFSSKCSFFQQEIANLGEEQALYGAIFECLGYRENRLAFRILTEQIPIEKLKSLPSYQARGAILFGTAGMLPDMTQASVLPEWKDTVADFWNLWWKYQTKTPVPIPWSQAATRPFNSPWRRLAAGFHLLENTACAPAKWLLSQGENALSPKDLRNRLQFLTNHPASWGGYRDFCHPLHPEGDLIGTPRFLDLCTNVLLPFLYTATPSPSTRTMALQTWLSLPAPQENHLVKEAALRFFQPPSRAKILLRTCAAHQGLLHIYHNFCLALENDCSSCPLVARK